MKSLTQSKPVCYFHMVPMRSTLRKLLPSPTHILLVDDNRDGVIARRSVLEELGYLVVPAHSGPEALVCLEVQPFDLIITDYKMDPMDGLEFIRTVRERKLSVPIILLSGFSDCLGLKPETTGANVVVQKSAGEISSLVRHTKRLLASPRKPARSAKQDRPASHKQEAL